MLFAFRFLTGFFGSPVLATGGASLADMYVSRKRAYAIAIWLVVDDYFTENQDYQTVHPKLHRR